MNGNMPSNHIACRIFASAMMFGILTALTTPSTTAVEPNAEVASAWWPDVENTWVPIGWKDHPLVPAGKQLSKNCRIAPTYMATRTLPQVA